MEIQLKNDSTVDVNLSITNDKGKSVNLNKLSPQDLIDILQEATEVFTNMQLEIEAILDNRNITGECWYNGEKKHWSEHIQENIYPRTS